VARRSLALAEVYRPPMIGCIVSGRNFSFAAIGLTPLAVAQVSAPLIGECYAARDCSWWPASRCACHPG
jgi:flavin reductase (DIM6/NTAB) family NADH-FMN oxidoreductase RutF